MTDGISPDIKREYHREYYRAHREEKREYYQAHRDERLAYQREYNARRRAQRARLVASDDGGE